MRVDARCERCETSLAPHLALSRPGHTRSPRIIQTSYPSPYFPRPRFRAAAPSSRRVQRAGEQSGGPCPASTHRVARFPAMQSPVQNDDSQRNKLHKHPLQHPALRRTPSAPLRTRAPSNPGAQPPPPLHHPSFSHHRSPTSPSPAAGSIDHITSRNLDASDFSPASSAFLSPQYSIRKEPSFELLGQRFDSAAILSNLDALTYHPESSARSPPLLQSSSPSVPPPTSPSFNPPRELPPSDPPQSSTPSRSPQISIPANSPPTSPLLRRRQFDVEHPRSPHPLQHAYSDSRVGFANPNIALSQSLAATGRQMDDIPQPRADLGMRSPRQRLSDEAKEGKLRKKSGFSSFVNNLVGTPRKPTISAPENPVHVTHVGYDQETGEFTVSWKEYICVIHADD